MVILCSFCLKKSLLRCSAEQYPADITCLMSTIEALEKGVKYFQS